METGDTHSRVVDRDSAVLEAQVSDAELIKIVRRSRRRSHSLPHPELAAALMQRKRRCAPCACGIRRKLVGAEDEGAGRCDGRVGGAAKDLRGAKPCGIDQRVADAPACTCLKSAVADCLHMS